MTSSDVFSSCYEIFFKISLQKFKMLMHFPPPLPFLGELVTTPLFDGVESYIAYPPLTNIHDDLRVELEFKPLDRDGLMFFCGGKKMKVEDFVAISMVEGHVEFRYELGTGKVDYKCAKLKFSLDFYAFLCLHFYEST